MSRKRFYVSGHTFDLSKIIDPKSSADIDVSKVERVRTYSPIPYEGELTVAALHDFLSLYKDDPEITNVEISNRDNDSWSYSESVISLDRLSLEDDGAFNIRKKSIQVAVFQAWKQYDHDLNKEKLTPEQKKMVRLEKLAKELGVKIEP
jgi:hypothetical protein